MKLAMLFLNFALLKLFIMILNIIRTDLLKSYSQIANNDKYIP